MDDNLKAQDVNDERHRDGCGCCSCIDIRIDLGTSQAWRTNDEEFRSRLRTAMASAWATMDQRSGGVNRAMRSGLALRFPEAVAECSWLPTDTKHRCEDIHPAGRRQAQALDSVVEARRRLAADPRVSPDLARRLLAFDQDSGFE